MNQVKKSFENKDATRQWYDNFLNQEVGLLSNFPPGNPRDYTNEDEEFPQEGPTIYYNQGKLHACTVYLVASALHIIGDTMMKYIVKNILVDTLNQSKIGSIDYIYGVLQGGYNKA